LHTKARLKISWYDPRLRWDPASYGGMTKIKLNSTRVWKPDIVLHNSVTGNFKTTEQGHYYKGELHLIFRGAFDFERAEPFLCKSKRLTVVITVGKVRSNYSIPSNDFRQWDCRVAARCALSN